MVIICGHIQEEDTHGYHLWTHSRRGRTWSLSVDAFIKRTRMVIMCRRIHKEDTHGYHLWMHSRRGHAWSSSVDAFKRHIRQCMPATPALWTEIPFARYPLVHTTDTKFRRHTPSSSGDETYGRPNRNDVPFMHFV